MPKNIEDAKKLQAGTLRPTDIKEEDRDYYLERRYPAFGNLVPRDVAAVLLRNAATLATVSTTRGLAVFLDFSSAIKRLGKDVVEDVAMVTSSRVRKDQPTTIPTRRR